MLVISIFFAISFLPTAKGSDGGCILLALPLPSHPNFKCNVHSINATELDFTLESECLFVVNSKLEYSTVEQYVSILFEKGTRNRECACSDVIGVVGDIDAKTASTINLLAGTNITIIATLAPSTFLPVTDLSLPNVLDMKPLLHFTRAATSFLRYWNWRRVGLITDNSIYYQFAAEYFVARNAINVTVTPHLIVSNANEFGRAHKEIIDYRTHVFILFMKKSLACLLLQSFLDEGLSWPKYAWIVAELESSYLDIIECTRNNVFFLEETFTSNRECIGYKIPGDHNIDSAFRIYFDEILVNAISLVGNSDSLDNFKNGKRLFNISIYFNSMKVAFYDPQLQDLFIIQDLSIGPSPNGDQEMVIFVDSLSTVLTVAILFPFCFVYVTIVFILYIWFRNEPEIKATSVLVSVCMFLGCYFWLIFVLTILSEESTFVCNLQVWLSGIGLSTLLVFVTLFVKMLRVYLIFLKPHSFRKKLLSNPMLLLYILLFLSPQLFVLLLWTATDTFTKVSLEFVQDHRLMIAERCVSNHASIWVILLLLYLISIMLVLVVFAFKTSKIRYKLFQDTKATNAFTFLVIFVTIQTLIYWFFFRTLSLEETFSSINKTAFALCVGHFAMIILCPTFLFVPKVYPPFKRYLVKNKVKSKPHNMSVSS